MMYIMKKVCNKCNIEKDITLYPSGRNDCKGCCSAMARNRLKTKEGCLRRIYYNQVSNSKIRGHQPPAYTQTEFILKYIKDPTYLQLHKDWVASGYLKKLAPSFDRADDTKGYSFNNLRCWCTWEENKLKGEDDIRKGVNQKTYKPVRGTCVKTNVIVEYDSLKNAAKDLRLHQANICKVCNGERTHTGGYKWEYIQ